MATSDMAGGNAVPSIRRATEADIGRLCELYFEFHEFHVRGVPGRLLSLGTIDTFEREKLSAGLREILKREDAAVFVAQLGKEVVGLVEVYLRQTPADKTNVASRVYGYVQSLLVTEPMRGQGVGRSLLAAAEDWAREKGAVESELDIWEFAEGPLQFYKQLGYQTIKQTMYRKL